MSIVLHGVAVGAGVAIGRAHLVVRGMDDVPHQELSIEEVPAEVARYEQAIKTTRRQLEQLRTDIPQNAPSELGAFISLHLMLVGDVSLSREPVDIIEAQCVNAEWALKLQTDKLSDQFDAIEDNYLRARKQDMLQVVERIFKNLIGLSTEVVTEAEDFEEDTILVAHDLSPADTVFFKDSRIAAFVTDAGGPTSHTAILGRSLDIPSVIALGYARELINEDELIIVDGTMGVVIIAPDDVILKEYRRRLREFRSLRRQLNKLKNTAATTLDGINIELLGNIESANDIKALHSLGMDGIGLYRSEFFYLNRDALPTEDELYTEYADVVKRLKGKTLTIRTIDLGVDKNPRWFGPSHTMNPALGLTGIRLCLAEPVMFRTQMRAIMRAAVLGPVRMMWPMISSVTEIQQCLTHLNTAKQQLHDRFETFDENIQVGAMIEIPSAALTVNSILKMIDFVSVGTNDLIQYTLAADRNDESVSYLYQPGHPAVLKLLLHVIRTAARLNKPVSVCGEMAGDAQYTRLLMAMGLRRFSMNANNILAVKNQIIQSDLLMLETEVQKILRNDDPDKALKLLKKLNSSHELSESAD
ncbi:Phosphoenolpyruvate-protein phosphotransferase of PTS system [Snodgrassella alvi wkB2]|uniref:Phosphoenolpyruvate-protein phosphotransferase n=1 Tax=Snodgrassella alvi TaxID=1196083 RepID=A0ABD7Z3U1_9NEIS|nr:phosphoenolpyruvate--protein phosphotransferase [Snodgrassella alvi]AHN27439.1 Phosphoenolpyruvate-protein phosphotransferase of PTS system [Snodgrassella alvi wkB2]ORF39468.1 phosphoenolpyruvate--protein phosphotransferase [Snodgrassella alvi]PIT43865.1 phosphoenolpyruvate--protein phosphotransferase [Snodgrassella alvi]PIT67540.1 phosphoenolpyruvate--protein phosphotransferase [Snodgrassella alvi]UOO99365.1 phosphoenolpyruvate--protein phosphotransferase [Snodgrassella alvi wkB2]